MKNIKYKDFYRNLFESPVDLNDTHDVDQYKFKDVENNKLITGELIKTGNSIGKFKKFEVFEIEKSEGGGRYYINLFVYDGSTCLKSEFYKHSGYVISRSVWQSPKEKGLFRDVILNYYVQNAKGWICGAYVSKMGKAAIFKLIDAAVESNLYVYITYKFNTQKRIYKSEESAEFFKKIGDGYDYRILFTKESKE